ncbi:MAG TPA: DUF6036 family nucleotidyltransferase [Kofleriaceae bacterium]|nr:DUF6036 family nucleotidyltransferase [Kofleriaceae bacterium]
MSTYRSSRAFAADEIRAFLRAVDRHLTRRARVEIIGGSAAALAHGATSTTTDVDTLTVMNAELEAAVARAVIETRLNISVSHAAVADVPLDYVERLERQLPELEKLEVWVLEKHDLVLSKTIRCYEHDLQQIREIRDRVGLSFDTLVERFRDEMSHVMGDPARIRTNFLVMIDDVFGELKRVAAERALKAAPIR